MQDLQAVLKRIAGEVRPLIAQGSVPDYIPALAQVPRERFGMAVATLEGGLYTVGDAVEQLSIQSISKAFTLTLAMMAIGERLWERVGREPSGSPFNSLVQLETEHGIPRNPFINAGALVVADVVIDTTRAPRDALLDFLRARAHSTTLADNPEVARSERAAGFRNAALANFLRSFGNLTNPVDQVLDMYCFQCSITASCVDLARAFAFLANGGACPWTGERVLTVSQAKRVNAIMLTCGTYDAAGDFAYHVGLPVKSGVGGGIVGVIPGQLAVAVWSPALDAKGNSVAGAAALERFTTLTGRSVF